MSVLQKTSRDLYTAFYNLIYEPTKTQFDDLICQLIERTKAHRLILEQMPMFPTQIAKCLEGVEGKDKTWSYKTSGSGGEDALIVIGSLNEIYPIERFYKA